MSFSLNETTLLSAISSGNIFSIINSILSPSYGIYLKSGAKAISPSSFLGIEYGTDSSVVSSPIEGGSYNSFNKVKRPSVIRVLFTLEGWTGQSGSIPNLTNFTLTSRTDMLGALDAMVNSAKTYDIETPDTTYEDYDLVRYNYRTSSQEVTLLTVEAIFEAILQEAEVTLTSTNAANSPTSNSTTKATSAVTEKANSTASNSTLDDVKGALTGLKDSVSSAATTVATSVTSAVSNVSSGATSAINGAATSAINNLSSTVKELVAGLS
ncbi:hypothetical protein N5923_23280 [Erwiniaceae bacterium BAC15a-03b]|uniref:Uncharacterized protein n=1 Tax=Winslowiella arboricola TaxID=2978220 RepID=A0A9J6PSH9_9GAMM|nr:hypothetical protein [Winslowiella arboricola]MCU5775128.1 hypothetical protein [Winslowiella arboricola]MCU5780418.1 hypothetical protein [Winslowiella arboricola]